MRSSGCICVSCILFWVRVAAHNGLPGRLNGEHRVQRRSLFIAAGSVACANLVGWAAWSQQNRIKGAGASFPRAVYESWGKAAREAEGIELAYEAVGSVEDV